MEAKVIDWAYDRGLLVKDNDKAQSMKLIEEVGELFSAILKGNRESEIDAFGDIQVVLIILACQRDVDLADSLELAYNEIKNRTGKTENGNFIKDADF